MYLGVAIRLHPFLMVDAGHTMLTSAGEYFAPNIKHKGQGELWINKINKLDEHTNTQMILP